MLSFLKPWERHVSKTKLQGEISQDYCLYKNEFRIFEPVEITIRQRLR
jgi:hypothetical protein